MPIFKADEGFFDYGLNAVGIYYAGQPSQAKLLDEVDDTFANLRIPTDSDHSYSFWIDPAWAQISVTFPAGSIAAANSEFDYDDEYFSQDFQTLIFPAFVVLR